MRADPQVPDIEAGRYVVVRTRGLSGWLIRMATGSSYDHALISAGHGEIIEAQAPDGVRAGLLAMYAGCPMAANLGEAMTDEQRANVVATARAKVGEGYSWGQIVHDALERFGLPWRWLLRFTRAGRRLMCSELVAECGVAAGLDGWQGDCPSVALVTPADLAAQPGVEPVSL